MAKEIERKFLVDHTKLPVLKNKIDYLQGYLSVNDSGITRIRIFKKTGILCIKSKSSGISRDEFEYEIPYEDATRLIKLSEGSIIKKTRAKLDFKDKIWEIDEFHDRNKGLWIAEVELRNENESIEVPPWATKEVTLDERYYNSFLCYKPYDTWSI
tara:strand:+ start:718 stop:1185 length:468 start_codon:yes stop_codon:yes gene_type:complete